MPYHQALAQKVNCVDACLDQLLVKTHISSIVTQHISDSLTKVVIQCMHSLLENKARSFVSIDNLLIFLCNYGIVYNAAQD